MSVSRILAVVSVLSCLALLPSCSASRPAFQGADRQRPQLEIKLERARAGGKKITTGVVTDIQFLPGQPNEVMVVAEKRGKLLMFDLTTGEEGTLLDLRDDTRSGYLENGLVGFTVHPDFAAGTKTLYTYHLRKRSEGGASTISEWTVTGADLASYSAGNQRTLLELPQPHSGHNGGQLAYGPDGYLYLAFGDGGPQHDRNNNSQDTTSFYGSLLRIDPDNPAGGKPYGIPADNPFVGGGHLPEVWAWGFRNPWRFSFLQDGSLLLADVGQEKREELNIVVKGGNYGWCLMQGNLVHGACARRLGEPDPADYLPPVYEYNHSEGAAVIGGPEYLGSDVPALSGKALFGDNTSGRLWAVETPIASPPVVYALGRTDVAITTFGRSPSGEVYVGGYCGRVFKIAER